MCRKALAIVFSSIFIALAILPAIASILDLDHNVLVLLDLNEEEEKKENKESKEHKDKKDKIEDIKIRVLDSKYCANFKLNFTKSSLDFYLNLYRATLKEIVSPPPEQFSII